MERGTFTHPSYDPDREQAWHLSILSGQGVSAWAVHALSDGAPVALHWAEGDNGLGSASNAGGTTALMDAGLPTKPRTVSFVTLPEWSTLVPEGALIPGSEPQHLALVHGGTPTGALRDEPVPSLGATCIYVHDDQAEYALLDRFPNARPLPMQALIVRAAIARCAAMPLVLMHRGYDRTDVAIATDGRLLLSNSYPTRSAQDLLYFMLLAVEGCGLKPAQVDMHHSGTHLTSGERDLLHRYFQHNAPAGHSSWENLAAGSGADLDRWLGVLEQFPCVS